MATICIIDDDSDVLGTLGGFFERAGYRVLTAASGNEGVRAVVTHAPDVVLLDLELPDLSGLEVLDAIAPVNPVVLVFSGHIDPRRAVEAMRRGAEGLLSKPIDLELLGAAAERAVEKARLRQLSRSLARGRGTLAQTALLGSSPSMRELGRQIELLARNDPSPLLVLGESGVGKGRVAEMLHSLSPRSDRAFVEVSCSALAGGLLDAELFGRESGPFDARERKLGLLESADGGTLYLDEVGALDAALQPKLLEVLEGKRFRRLGGAQDVPVNVRLICSTARDLVSEVNEGRFREDLYYRISIMPIHLPPLRARAREDVSEIMTRLIEELHTALPESPAELGDDAREQLLRHSWPGNVRELRNVLERAMIVARGHPRLEPSHLPAEIRRPAAGASSRHTPRSLAEVERRHIERTLRAHNQNRTRAARELGISRATLINKIKTYGLERGSAPELESAGVREEDA